MDYQGMGRRVRRGRKLEGLTQAGFAARLGISTSFLGHIERGTRKASLETMVKIANALNASLDELLADSLHTSPGASAGYSPRQRLALRDALHALARNVDAFMDEPPSDEDGHD